MTARVAPTLDLEAELWRRRPDAVIAGMDEVGRGALAGPVSVGVALVRADAGPFPLGLADSKLLRAAARESLVEPVRAWVLDAAVGHARPGEIDAVGIVAALRLAGTRALAALAARGHRADVVLLDGTHDWLTPPPADLFAPPGGEVGDGAAGPLPPVHTVRKGDATCASIAAASVLAKVERDAVMTALPDPGYGFAGHKGYGSAAHQDAIRRLGAGDAHRRSWRLPEPLERKA